MRLDSINAANAAANDSISNDNEKVVKKERTKRSVAKKTKNGIQDQDIIPMIRKLEIVQIDANVLELNARICCQNPTLNPMQIAAAIEKYLPEFLPDHVCCCRKEIRTYCC